MPAAWLLVAWLLLDVGTLRAQDEPARRTSEVEVSADRLEGDLVNGERIRRLIGNVHLRQDDTRLWSRRAVQYLDRREILFTGEVLIVERGDSLWADTVLYDSRFKTGTATGNVRLSDGDVVVLAPSGLYFTEEKRAEFMEGVTMIDSTTVLESEGGQYWSDEKRAEFYGNVVLTETRTHLEADSVTYYRETDVSIARGNVFVERIGDDDGERADSLTRTVLFGRHVYNDDRAGYSRIEGRPLLVQVRRDSTGAEADTLLIRASVLESSREDSLHRLVAVDSVQIWQQDLSAVADSVVYDRITFDGEPSREEVRLFRSPVAWFQHSQVTGDTILVKAREGSVETLFVRANAFVAREDSALQRIHQLRGRDLEATFANDELRRLSIGPRAEAINYRSDEQNQRAGAVQMSSDRIVLGFESEDLRTMHALSDVEGEMVSEEQMPETLRLEGFHWMPERRPTKERLLGPFVIPATPAEIALRAEIPAQRPDGDHGRETEALPELPAPAVEE